MQSIIGLIDCNNFYASCERVFNPALAGKPILVLSSNDGCIIGRSNEAKELGIPMGATKHTVETTIKKHNIHCFSTNFPLYGDLSERVMRLIHDFFPSVEVYSVDESFIQFAATNEEDALIEAQTIQNKIQQYLGIPTSIGIGTTKVLAKLANRHAKITPSLNGICSVLNPKVLHPVLQDFPIHDIWGFGKKNTQLLLARNIKTAADFINLPPAWVRKVLHLHGLRIWYELQEKSCYAWQEEPDSRKNILRSRSFSQYLNDKEDLFSSIATHITSASAELRKQDSLAAFLTVFVCTNRFSSLPFYENSITIGLPDSTDFTPTLLHHARLSLDKIYRSGYKYKKTGIILSEIHPRTTAPITLGLNYEEDSRNRHLMTYFDKIRKKFGKNILRYASSTQNDSWHPKCQQQSKRYTTSWNDLLHV